MMGFQFGRRPPTRDGPGQGQILSPGRQTPAASEITHGKTRNGAGAAVLRSGSGGTKP